jgi:hypothetical protein
MTSRSLPTAEWGTSDDPGATRPPSGLAGARGAQPLQAHRRPAAAQASPAACGEREEWVNAGDSRTRVFRLLAP